MFSKRFFVVIGLAVIALGFWYTFQTFEYEYSRRPLDDGTYRISSVVCGEAASVIFFEQYDEDVRGPATAADCTRLARTRVVEAVGIGIIGVLIGYLGYRFGAEPVRPIDSELPRLPKGLDRTVHGRHRRPGRD
jgi:hypothetical protein